MARLKWRLGLLGVLASTAVGFAGGVPFLQKARQLYLGTQLPDCLSGASAEENKVCALRYLERWMPSWDKDNLGSLRLGILNDTVDSALDARLNSSWAADVPWAIWRNWVLPYASVNEARSSWRMLFQDRVSPLVHNASFDASSLREAVTILNTHLWSSLRTAEPIVFRSQQTPKIYDPMSTISFGYASCTGISIMLVDALRAAGVPARLAGTPAWNGVVENGNHNWVEVWLGDEAGWTFMEGLPAGGGSLDDPCTKWFCSPGKMAGTEVFATQWERVTNDSVYPMSWDFDNQQVPGLNRTSYYRHVCGGCGR